MTLSLRVADLKGVIFGRTSQVQLPIAFRLAMLWKGLGGGLLPPPSTQTIRAQDYNTFFLRLQHRKVKEQHRKRGGLL